MKKRVNARIKLTTPRERNRGVMMTDLEYIAETLSEEDILCQIAEEAAELAQAALKLRRAITQTNPTPVSDEEAVDSIIEEYADTIGAFEIWAAKCGGDGVRLVGYDLAEIIDAKYARKVKQIKEGKKHE